MAEIIKAKKQHIEDIVRFQVLMAMETEDLKLDEDVVRQGVEYIFDHNYRGEYWLTTDNEMVIASMLVQYEWSDWRNGDVLWVHSVYVLPEYRNQGVFSKMYASLKERVHTDPTLRGIRLYVDKTNQGAQSVYKGLEMRADHYDLYEWLKS
jgi:GNAT superfamily N-acetyltransferase